MRESALVHGGRKHQWAREEEKNIWKINSSIMRLTWVDFLRWEICEGFRFFLAKHTEIFDMNFVRTFFSLLNHCWVRYLRSLEIFIDICCSWDPFISLQRLKSQLLCARLQTSSLSSSLSRVGADHHKRFYDFVNIQRFSSSISGFPGTWKLPIR